jgi:hypothetical protein
MAKVFFHDGDLPLCRPRPSWEQVRKVHKTLEEWKFPNEIHQLMAGPCWDPEQKKFVGGNVSVWLVATKEVSKEALMNDGLDFQMNVWFDEPGVIHRL